MMKPKQPDITIIVTIGPRKMLTDMRLGKNFAKFGNVLDVARQYGVKAQVMPQGIQFSAPKSRMQMFVEKLHFSKVMFWEI